MGRSRTWADDRALAGRPSPPSTFAATPRRLETRREPPPTPPVVRDVLRSPGQPMSGLTRARFGHAFSRVRVHKAESEAHTGASLVTQPTDRTEREADAAAAAVSKAEHATQGQPPSPEREERAHQEMERIRVHTGEQAAKSAAVLGAEAYSVGDDIVFGAGRYAPGTPAGDKLLAHEVAHVLQSRAGRVAPGVIRRQPSPSPAPSPATASKDEWSPLPAEEPKSPSLFLTYDLLQKTLATNTQPVANWLDAHTSELILHGMGQIVTKVRLSLKEAASLSDAELQSLVREWAQRHKVAIPVTVDSGQPAPPSASELKSAVQTGTPGAKVTVKRQGLDLILSATGSLLGQKARVAAAASLPTTLVLAASYMGMHFTGTLSTDKWTLQLSYPADTMVHSVSELTRLFSKSMAAIGEVYDTLGGLRTANSVDDLKAMSTRAGPSLNALSDAWDVFKGLLSKPPKSRVSAGVSVKGPHGSESSVPGLTVTGTVTIWF